MTAKFEVGKTYYDRAASDWNTVYRFTILARTEKTVTIEVYGQRVRRGISVYEGIEKFKPFGTYSMCAIVSADRPLKTEKEQTL